MTKERAAYLYERHLHKTLTRPEAQELKAFAANPEFINMLHSLTDRLWDADKPEVPDKDTQRANEIYENIVLTAQAKKVVRLWPRMAIAAAIMLAVFGAGYFYFNAGEPSVTSGYTSDIAPGRIGATLTLNNGKKIRLSDVVNGTLAKESGVLISKTANGQLIYEISNEAIAQSDKVNTLTTAKGETYQVKLPDGTMIWLNAGSSLKYPASFASLSSRKIELTGEAYFEVAKDKRHPFVVKTAKQEVKVLGTHFNINSYEEEPAVKTTLLEGSVEVTSDAGLKKLLSPNQQSSLYADQLRVENIDAELAAAWKNNLFIFEDHDIQFIMRTIERWYNVKVIYEGPKPEGKFGGSTSRFENVSKVLEILESTKKVHFKIEGRNILVSKDKLR